MPPPRGELRIGTLKQPPATDGVVHARALGAAFLLDHLHQQDLTRLIAFLDL